MSKPHKLPSGSWRIQWLDAYGKRKSETYETSDAARSALRRRVTEVEDIRSGRARPRSDLTLRDAAPGWLASRTPSPGSPPDVMRRRGKRVRDNRMHLDKHILPVLGDKRLPEINADVIKMFVRGLESKRTARRGEKNEAGRTLRPATIANVIITLRKLLSDLGYPVRVSYKVPTSGYAWIKSTTDVARFLGACRPGWFRTACELAVYAGLRQGEVAGLTWTAVDFDRGLLVIDRSYDGPTKSKHARAVPLAPELAVHLKRWRLEHGAVGGELVITCPDKEGRERPLPEDSDMGKRVRRACKRAGVAPVTFHQLRHTAASHMAERVPLAIVGAVLGHADPKTTARYAHIDTAGLARDPRLHLQFEAPSGTVTPLPVAAAHDLHTAGEGRAAQGK